MENRYRNQWMYEVNFILLISMNITLKYEKNVKRIYKFWVNFDKILLIKVKRAKFWQQRLWESSFLNIQTPPCSSKISQTMFFYVFFQTDSKYEKYVCCNVFEATSLWGANVLLEYKMFSIDKYFVYITKKRNVCLQKVNFVSTFDTDWLRVKCKRKEHLSFVLRNYNNS